MLAKAADLPFACPLQSGVSIISVFPLMFV